jgi:hypothetical protein
VSDAAASRSLCPAHEYRSTGWGTGYSGWHPSSSLLGSAQQAFRTAQQHDGSSVKRTVRGTLAMMTAVGVAICIQGSASAERSGRAPFSLRAWQAPQPQPITAVSGAKVIVCNAKVQQPHKSSHVPGTINVVATIACTHTVPSLAVGVGLYRNGRLVKLSRVRAFRNTRIGANNAAVPCSSGSYRGAANFAVVFPPGFNPPSRVGRRAGDARKIQC